MNTIKTQKVQETTLNRLEELLLQAGGKKQPYTLIRHDAQTVYINADHPAADQIEEITRELLELHITEEQTTAGATAADLLDRLEKIAGADAVNRLLKIWLDEKSRRTKAAKESAAAAWYTDNKAKLAQALEAELPGMDAGMLQALYFTTKATAEQDPAADTSKEYPFIEALRAVFFYGYMAGAADAKLLGVKE